MPREAVTTALVLGSAVALGLLTGWMASERPLPEERARRALIPAGAQIPDVELTLTSAEVSLRRMLAETAARFLVVVSVRCSDSLGELMAWSDVGTASEGRALALLLDADDGTVERLRRLLPGDFAVARLSNEGAEQVGAIATPIVYQLTADHVVQANALGARESWELREIHRAQLEDEGRGPFDRRENRNEHPPERVFIEP